MQADGEKHRTAVLYHIISTYQLLCAIVHHLTCTPDKKAVLLVPDFYTAKSPDILSIRGIFFDEVYLFPYLKIPHNKRTIPIDTKNAWGNFVPYNLSDFEHIFVAGVQFYFTDLLIRNNISFSCFEEAAGIYSRPKILEKNIGRKYPIQKRWAKKNKLLDYKNPLIDKVYCLMRAQKSKADISKAVDFDVMEHISSLSVEQMDKLINYFVKEKYIGGKNSVIVLTEQFANLGKMTETQQYNLYSRMSEALPKELKVYVKPHPDDNLDYSKIFNDSVIINGKFPSELLPFIFEERPTYIASVSSTGEDVLNQYFIPILGKNTHKMKGKR